MPKTVMEPRAGNADPDRLYLDVLVKKHEREINIVLDLPMDKQRQFFESFGIDTDALMRQYPGLKKTDERLSQENIQKTRKAGLISAGVFFASLTGLLATPKKYFSGSSLIKGFMAFFFSVGSGVATYWGTTHLFTDKLRNESRDQLTWEGRDQMRYQLAALFESLERSGAGVSISPVAQTNPVQFASQVSRTAPPVPSESHASAVSSTTEASKVHAL